MNADTEELIRKAAEFPEDVQVRAQTILLGGIQTSLTTITGALTVIVLLLVALLVAVLV